MNRKYIPYIRKSYLKMQQSIINSPSVKTTDAFESVSDLTQVPSINNTIIDLELKTVIEAFQRRFIPESINGIIDLNVIRRINTIVKKS